jgi:hypothetical protein
MCIGWLAGSEAFVWSGGRYSECRLVGTSCQKHVDIMAGCLFWRLVPR